MFTKKLIYTPNEIPQLPEKHPVIIKVYDAGDNCLFIASSTQPKKYFDDCKLFLHHIKLIELILYPLNTEVRNIRDQLIKEEKPVYTSKAKWLGTFNNTDKIETYDLKQIPKYGSGIIILYDENKLCYKVGTTASTPREGLVKLYNKCNQPPIFPLYCFISCNEDLLPRTTALYNQYNPIE